MIRIRPLTEQEYEVEVSGALPTIHRVTLRDDDRAFAAACAVSPEELIKESFRFLLERESGTSILRSFELSVIGRYFPEYRAEMVRRFARQAK